MHLNSKVSRKVFILVNFILVQSILFIVAAVYMYCRFSGVNLLSFLKWEYVSFLLVFFGVAFSIASIYLVNEIIRLAEKESEAEIANIKLLDSKNMVDNLRSQRHDFVNHMQVIYGLIKLGRPEQVEEYIREISTDLVTFKQSVNLAKPEVSAIIMNKMAQAQKDGIEISCEISTTLENLNITGSELVGVLSNLMDNAIRALNEVSVPNKKFKVVIYEKDQGYIFEIFNSAPIIPKDVQKKIFDKGFSTKSESGHGYGLFIVKNLVDKNGGYITVNSEESYGTIFKVYFPEEQKGEALA